MLCVQVTQAFGANRWDTAEFINESEKEKFIKLMVSNINPLSLLYISDQLKSGVLSSCLTRPVCSNRLLSGP